MALIERLLSTGPDKIHGHQFMAVLREFRRGAFSRLDVIAAFDMDASDVAQLDVVIAHYQTLTDAEKLDFGPIVGDALLLAEEGIAYTTPAELRARIGI